MSMRTAFAHGYFLTTEYRPFTGVCMTIEPKAIRRSSQIVVVKNRWRGRRTRQSSRFAVVCEMS